MQSEAILTFIYWFPFAQFIWFFIGYNRLKINSFNTTDSSLTLIIPYRNEQENLPSLIKNLNQIILRPKDQIILVDDNSTDSGITDELFLRKEITILHLKDDAVGSKKQALTQAILQSSSEWILTTDADCEFGEKWVQEMRTKLNPDLHMLIGPVLTKPGSGLQGWLQTCESVCLWSVSRASAGWNMPVLCSGANLLFRRTSWIEVGGYKAHQHILSGDDVLLMNDFSKRWKNGVRTINSRQALVLTKSLHSWKQILDQRKRWSSKRAHVGGLKKKLLLLGLAFWLFLPIAALFYDFRFPVVLFLMETGFVWSVLHGFNLSFKVSHWLLFRVAYPFFLVLLMFYKPSKVLWKGRVLQ
jgi:glycosyltransferase involved in cell wall biosynthesis